MLERENFHEKKDIVYYCTIRCITLLMRINVWLEPVKDAKGNMWLNLVMRKLKPILQSKLKSGTPNRC